MRERGEGGDEGLESYLESLVGDKDDDAPFSNRHSPHSAMSLDMKTVDQLRV